MERTIKLVLKDKYNNFSLEEFDTKQYRGFEEIDQAIASNCNFLLDEIVKLQELIVCKSYFFTAEKVKEMQIQVDNLYNLRCQVLFQPVFDIERMF